MKELVTILWHDLIWISKESYRSAILNFFFSRQFHLLASYRIGHFVNHVPILKWLNPFLRYFMCVFFGSEIHFSASIGERILFPHPFGIVIGNDVQIGDDVVIFHHVTIGSHGKPGMDKKYPIIEAGVTMYCNSSILGSVHVGKNAVIGAHSLVLDDVVADSIYVGVPARKVNVR